MIVTRVSPLTGVEHSLDLPVTQAQLDEMAAPPSERRYVQHIFPELNAAEREFVKTGITAEEWDAAFPDE